MNTPLYTSLRQLADKHTARFHMPGHKGYPLFEGFGDIFSLDFTETYDTGNLYEEEGAIRQAEKIAAAYYQAADCHFLTGGSSQGIQTMLGALCSGAGQVLLDRTCHKSVMHACALFDLQPEFIMPNFLPYAGCGGLLDLAKTEHLLQSSPNAAALMVVSPNYYGVLQPISKLAALCHRYGKLLLVDGAHGAHLPAVDTPSPIALGADAAVLSAHKTLPALGQGAYLLLGANVNAAQLRRFACMCGTSSPSYPIMASLDLARNELESNARAYSAAVAAVADLRQKYDGRNGLRALSYADAPLDPLRLTLSCTDGLALSDRLYETFGIAVEMADRNNIVCIVTPQDLPENLARLTAALSTCAENAPLQAASFLTPPTPIRALSVRQALFSKGICVSADQAPGHICARAVTPYPPGVPLLWPGEEIQPKHIEFLSNRCYNIVDNFIVCAP